MTKIIMLGCNGRMGQMITDMVKQDDECTIVAGIDIVDNRDNGYPVYTKLADCDVEADAIIDFTSATDFESRMDYAVDKQIPIIECSTGLSEEQMDYLKKASEKVAVLKTANMSLGINLLMKLLKEAAVKLAGDGFDVEIVEKHHNQKLDAPSGTALALADSINEAMDDRYEYIYDRSQVRQKRDKKELGISAVRGGTIVGEHEVIFAGTDEVITFKHTAYSRAVFAKGSITAEKILILHSLLSGLDILTAIILLVAVLSGLATGLVVKLGQIMAVIGSYVIAAVLASYVGLGREIDFVVAFIVLSIICRYLVQVLRLVDKLPVVGTLDKFGGAVVGFVVAFVVLYFVINLFFDIVPQSTLDGMGWTKEAVQKTMFIKGFLKR